MFLFKKSELDIAAGLRSNVAKNDWVIKHTVKEETFGAIARMVSVFGAVIEREAAASGFQAVNTDRDFEDHDQTDAGVSAPSRRGGRLLKSSAPSRHRRLVRVSAEDDRLLDMGSRTYETALAFEPKGLGWSYGDKPTVVLTRRALRKTRDSVEFYAGDLGRLVGEKLTPNFRNIWFVGGASLRGAKVGSHPSGAHGHGMPTAFAPAAQVTPLALK